jgi:hypothetical protein
MDDSYEDCLVNLNTVTVAGKVASVEKISGKVPGLVFIISYQKHWPSGGVQEIPIRCYVSGEARIEKLDWLRPGEWVLAHGEVTDKGSIYAHQIEQLSRPSRGDELDHYFERMAEEQAWQGR